MIGQYISENLRLWTRKFAKMAIFPLIFLLLPTLSASGKTKDQKYYSVSPKIELSLLCHTLCWHLRQLSLKKSHQHRACWTVCQLNKRGLYISCQAGPKLLEQFDFLGQEENISNTPDSFCPHFQTPRSSSKIIRYVSHFHSLLGVSKCGQFVFDIWHNDASKHNVMTSFFSDWFTILWLFAENK